MNWLEIKGQTNSPLFCIFTSILVVCRCEEKKKGTKGTQKRSNWPQNIKELRTRTREDGEPAIAVGLEADRDEVDVAAAPVRTQLSNAAHAIDLDDRHAKYCQCDHHEGWIFCQFSRHKMNSRQPKSLFASTARVSFSSRSNQAFASSGRWTLSVSARKSCGEEMRIASNPEMIFISLPPLFFLRIHSTIPASSASHGVVPSSVEAGTGCDWDRIARLPLPQNAVIPSTNFSRLLPFDALSYASPTSWRNCFLNVADLTAIVFFSLCNNSLDSSPV